MQTVLCEVCGKQFIEEYDRDRVIVHWGILAFAVETISCHTCPSCAAQERLEEIKKSFNHDNKWFRQAGHDIIRGKRPSQWIITAKQRGTATDFTIFWEGYFDVSSRERKQRLMQYMEELGILSREPGGHWQIVDEHRGIVITPQLFSIRLYLTRRADAADFVHAYNENSYWNFAYAHRLMQ